MFFRIYTFFSVSLDNLIKKINLSCYIFIYLIAFDIQKPVWEGPPCAAPGLEGASETLCCLDSSPRLALFPSRLMGLLMSVVSWYLCIICLYVLYILSVCLNFCLSEYLSVCISYLSVYISYLSVWISVCKYNVYLICLSEFLSVCIFYLSVCIPYLSVWISVYLYILFLSVCLNFCLYAYLICMSEFMFVNKSYLSVCIQFVNKSYLSVCIVYLICLSEFLFACLEYKKPTRYIHSSGLWVVFRIAGLYHILFCGLLKEINA